MCNYYPNPTTGTYHHDSSPRMAIPTNSDGHILHWSCCVPWLYRQTNWLAHLVPLKTRLRHHIQIDVHLSAAVPNIWHPRWTQHRWWPTFCLQNIPRIPSDVVREAQTILSHIPPIQWPVPKHPKVLAYHRRNSYFTTDSMIPSPHNQSSTSSTLNE